MRPTLKQHFKRAKRIHRKTQLGRPSCSLTQPDKLWQNSVQNFFIHHTHGSFFHLDQPLAFLPLLVHPRVMLRSAWRRKFLGVPAENVADEMEEQILDLAL